MPRRNKRDISGVILLNKPRGITSNDAMIRIRGIYNAQKAGHTGALDPLATGMLPICLGEATKFSQFLLDADKTYEVTARLGIRTTTSDMEGTVISENEVHLTEDQLLDAMAHFIGAQKQVPSMYSALKYQGHHYYEYARKGIEIPREARDIVIYSFKLVNFDGRDASMVVHCSKGTYIRSLVDDLGQFIGCGAHVIRLNRIQVADYPADRMVSFEDIDKVVNQCHEKGFTAFSALDNLLLTVDTAVQKLPVIYLGLDEGRRIMLGQRIKVRPVNMLTTDLQPIRICIGTPEKNTFAGVGEIRYDVLAPKRLITQVQNGLTTVFPEEENANEGNLLNIFAQENQ